MVASVVWGVLLSSGSPIDLDGTFFLQVGIFFVAFFILKSLVFRPVVELFDARDAAMSGAKRDAETMNVDAEHKREHLETELRRVRQVSTEHRDRLRAEAQTLARKLSSCCLNSDLDIVRPRHTASNITHPFYMRLSNTLSVTYHFVYADIPLRTPTWPVFVKLPQRNRHGVH